MPIKLDIFESFFYNLVMEKYENLTEIIAENLIYYRKKGQYTQSQLAEQLGYSDKSISKWERGEGVPDIHVLVQLAKLYGLSVNDFLVKKKKEKIANRFFSKVLLTLISCMLVWVVATALFLILKIFIDNPETSSNLWKIFIYAIPTTFVVLTTFNSIYFKPIHNIYYVSGLCWTLALSIHMAFIYVNSIHYIYFVAIPFQFVIVFFFVLIQKKRK